MATIKIVDVINRAKIISQDLTSVRWTGPEWLKWYNDAILAVVNRRPDASIVNGSFLVSNTDSKQYLPSNALRLMTVMRNSVSGVPIRHIGREVLDDQVPNWHVETGANIDHFVYDERDPKSFYVYPTPAVNNHEIEVIYSVTPVAAVITDFENDTSVIAVDDNYLNPILDFMLYRAYSKDADYAENGQRSLAHMQAFESSLGVKTKTDSSMISRPMGAMNG